MIPEQRHRTRSSFIVNFENIPHAVLDTYESDTSDVVLAFLFLILNTLSVLI